MTASPCERTQKLHQLISHGNRNRRNGACLPHSYEWGMRRRVRLGQQIVKYIHCFLLDFFLVFFCNINILWSNMIDVPAEGTAFQEGTVPSVRWNGSPWDRRTQLRMLFCTREIGRMDCAGFGQEPGVLCGHERSPGKGDPLLCTVCYGPVREFEDDLL